jgi:hypothetical protein
MALIYLRRRCLSGKFKFFHFIHIEAPPCLPEIAPVLHGRPAFRRPAQRDGQAQCHLKHRLQGIMEKLYQHKRRQCPNRRYWEKKMFVLKTVLRRKMRVGRNASLLQPSNKTPIRPDALAG